MLSAFSIIEELQSIDRVIFSCIQDILIAREYLRVLQRIWRIFATSKYRVSVQVDFLFSFKRFVTLFSS